MFKNTIHFLLHLFFFCLFYFCHFCCGVHSNTRAKNLNQREKSSVSKFHLQKQFLSSSVTYLNLVCIHTSICNKNLCIFNSFWLIYTNLLVKQKACSNRKAL